MEERPSGGPVVVPLSLNGANFPAVSERRQNTNTAEFVPRSGNEEVSELSTSFTPQKRARASSGNDDNQETLASGGQRAYKGSGPENRGSKGLESGSCGSTRSSSVGHTSPHYYHRDAVSDIPVPVIDDFAVLRSEYAVIPTTSSSYPEESTPLVHAKPHHISPIETREPRRSTLAKDPPMSGTNANQSSSSFVPSRDVTTFVVPKQSELMSDHFGAVSSTLAPSRRDLGVSSRPSTTPPPLSLSAPLPPPVPLAALPHLGGGTLGKQQSGPADTPTKRTQSKPPTKGLGGMPPSPTTRTRDGRIKVVVRKRPLMEGEPGSDCVSACSPQLTLEVTKQRVDLSEYTQRSEYCFDDVFSEEQNNMDVYRSCGLGLLDVALAGGSSSCFAYGQTGSGKTHTMMGSDKEQGLYLLAASDLFARLTSSHLLQVSFYEIYCNSLFDLLNARNPVVLREGGDRRVNVCGLSWHQVNSSTELWQIISAGMEQRKTGSTSANEQSSRSHAVLSIRITNTEQPDFQGIVNFVDLAGSERAADTAANEKQTRLEGAEINKSLLALKECIRSLDERKKHVPFRGSRLTEVLRDSFTGNSKTIMIANISPSSINFEHTQNTLRYAFRVKGLSVATVAPDKARNAPRPFAPPPARNRSKTQDQSTPTKSNSRPSPERIGGRRDRAALPSPVHAPETRQSGSHSNDLLKNIVGKELSQKHSNSLSSCAIGEDSFTQEIRAKMHLGRGGMFMASVTGNSTTSSYVDTSGMIGAGASSTERRNGNSMSGMTDEAGFSPRTRDELEERFRRSIVRKVQRDLGREIQYILDERDSLIAQLKKENTELKRQVEQLQAVSPSQRVPDASDILLSSVPFPKNHRDIAPTIKPSEAFVVPNSAATLESSQI